MSTELATVNNAPISVDEIRKQKHLIQEAMLGCMVDGTHYGKVPGCGDKPSLLKPGAETISMIFRLMPRFDVRREDLPGGHREFSVVCTLETPSGSFAGQGVGSCSTMESKYRWRKSERLCPECGKDTIIKGKEEYGGGWLCFARKGGCGAKFPTGDESIEAQVTGRVENSDLADQYNTVLKMAKKRAHVDAVITATSAGDIFTQDIEDLKPPVDPSAPAEMEDRKAATAKVVDAAKVNTKNGNGHAHLPTQGGAKKQSGESSSVPPTAATNGAVPGATKVEQDPRSEHSPWLHIVEGKNNHTGKRLCECPTIHVQKMLAPAFAKGVTELDRKQASAALENIDGKLLAIDLLEAEKAEAGLGEQLSLDDDEIPQRQMEA
jgi:hypothetical protein